MTARDALDIIVEARAERHPGLVLADVAHVRRRT